MGVYERMFGEDGSSCGKVLDQDEERVEGDKKVRKRTTIMSQI